MTRIEREYIALEEELSSRRIKLRKDKLYFYLTILGVGLFMLFNLTMNTKTKAFLINQEQGQIFLLILSSIFLVNTLLGLTLNDQKY